MSENKKKCSNCNFFERDNEDEGYCSERDDFALDIDYCKKWEKIKYE